MNLTGRCLDTAPRIGLFVRPQRITKASERNEGLFSHRDIVACIRFLRVCLGLVALNHADASGFFSMGDGRMKVISPLVAVNRPHKSPPMAESKST